MFLGEAPLFVTPPRWPDLSPRRTQKREPQKFALAVHSAESTALGNTDLQGLPLRCSTGVLPWVTRTYRHRIITVVRASRPGEVSG